MVNPPESDMSLIVSHLHLIEKCSQAVAFSLKENVRIDELPKSQVCGKFDRSFSKPRLLGGYEKLVFGTRNS
jgi:hypothetical protein